MNYELKQKNQRKEKDSCHIVHDLYFMIPNSFQRGQAVITTVVFFLIIATTISFGVIKPALRQVKQVDDFARTRASLFVSQSVNEDAVYRLKNGKQFVSPSTISLDGYSATASLTSVAGGFQIDSSSSGFNLVRKIQTHLTSGSGTSFNYGVQVGDGGVIFENFSTVSGNLYSNGPVKGSGNNLIKGDVISAGPNGKIESVHATSSAYAHDILTSTIDKDAYYQTISGSTVGGALHPGSPDQATSSLPISDAVIAGMEAEALAGGVINSPCPYSTGNNVILGPVKINCDLKIDGDTVTLGGTVWVAGNIEVSNTSLIKIDPSLGKKSVAVIADKPSDHTNSSIITLSNSTKFQGSGTPGSFVVLISQNDRASHGNGEGEEAINVQNSVSGALLVYAARGEINIQNNVSLKEVTAYRLRLKNNVKVVYDTGLASLLFSSGPAGGYVFDKWREIQ